MTIQYINRPAPFALDPAVALLGNEPEGLAIDFARNRAYDRDRAVAANNYLGNVEGKFPLVRASDGSRYDATRKLVIDGPDVLRLTHDPLTGEALGALLEGGATNLLTFSDDASKSPIQITSMTITADQIAAPDGSQTADLVVPNAGVNASRLRFTGSGTRTYSFFVKSAGIRYLGINPVRPNTRCDVYDLVDGVVKQRSVDYVADARITKLPNDWRRITSTFAASDCFLLNAASMDGRAFDETIANDGVSGFYLWGAQLEAGSFATSYIKTTTGAGTRMADSLSFARPGTPEGTVVIKGRTAPAHASGQYLWFWGVDTVNRLCLQNTSTGRLEFIVQAAGTVKAKVTSPILADDTDFGIAATWTGDQIAMSLNAAPALVGSGVGGVLPAMTTMAIGGSHTGSNNWYGTVASLRVTPRAADPTQLPGLLS